MDVSGKSDPVPENGDTQSLESRRPEPPERPDRSREGAGEVTGLLQAWHAGDEDAYRQVAAIVYDELKRQAARYMRREKAGDTLQTTALVHEVFVRLVDAGAVDWQNRRHFLAIAGRTMRRVLVDMARGADAVKRGAGADRISLNSDMAASAPEPADFIALDEALERLATMDPRKVLVIELRFFAGLSIEETAEVLEVSPDTVTRDWRMARAWLRSQLGTEAKL
jgi:RNA polymerase sigma factor (TIGR02999 family)